MPIRCVAESLLFLFKTGYSHLLYVWMKINFLLYTYTYVVKKFIFC